jgi:DNA-3-methyladenine glycosylase II
LAGAAASTIHERVRKLSPKPGRFLTPGEMLSLPEADLRGAGLSKSKTKAIRDLANRVVSGELKLSSLSRLPDQKIVDQITEVWGLGEWSAQMFLLFHLGRLDVFAPGDLGLREGMRILDGLDERPGPAEAEARAEVWAPLRSVASWYLWRLTDG